MADTEKETPPHAPQPAVDAPDQETFLARWSRLKREAGEQPAAKPQPTATAADSKAQMPDLPPLDKLTFNSDYRAFFHPEVGEDVRRAALKKLFSDARFNVMDGLDVYIDDYSKSEPIPAAMLAQLKQAEKILAWARGETEPPRGEVEKRVAEHEPPRPDELTAQEAPSADLPSTRPGSQYESEPAPGTAQKSS
ncbi:MAG: DUF3306 domain-containing protein [Betaproteobacteria bacterium]|nr:DUF3306 domain-containing protein [Betaproteobacteria bacterium]